MKEKNGYLDRHLYTVSFNFNIERKTIWSTEKTSACYYNPVQVRHYVSWWKNNNVSVRDFYTVLPSLTLIVTLNVQSVSVNAFRWYRFHTRRRNRLHHFSMTTFILFPASRDFLKNSISQLSIIKLFPSVVLIPSWTKIHYCRLFNERWFQVLKNFQRNHFLLVPKLKVKFHYFFLNQLILWHHKSLMTTSYFARMNYDDRIFQ